MVADISYCKRFCIFLHWFPTRRLFGLCSNEFVNDCVRYFYDKRVAGVRGDHLKPVKKIRPQHQYDTSSVALPRRSAPQFGDGSGDQVVSSGRPDRQRNVWWRSGMRCVDAGAKISEPPDYRVDQQQDEEVEPRSRRTRFRAHNSEPDNKMDMDWVMSQIDQIDFHESKNKLSSDNCTAAPANAYNASSSMSATCLPISSDVGNLSPVAGETLAQSSISRSYTNVSNHEPRSLPSGDGLATSSLQSSDTASCMRNGSLVTTPPKAGSFADAHIPQLKSVAGDTSTEQLDTRDLPNPLHSSPLEPVQRDEHGSEVLTCHTSDQIDSFSQLSQSVVHDLPARGDAVLAYTVAEDDILVDEVAIIERDSSAEREEVVSSSQLIPVGHDSQPQMSSDNIHTRRLLSADAAYCLQQEDDDVIVESSFEEDFDDE